MKYVDIGFNLVDPMFRGVYNGKQVHAGDIQRVLERARSAQVGVILAISGSLSESRDTLKFCNSDQNPMPGRLFTTVGCHPTRCSEMEGDSNYISALKDIITQDAGQTVLAVGEMGLDYDRTEFCPRETQTRCFREQLKLASEVRLPLYLHYRNAREDFFDILDEHRNLLRKGGVVHSYTGSMDDMKALITEYDLHIGINGCSLKTSENLEVVKEIPINKILLETDSPWCSVRKTHASYALSPQNSLPERDKKAYSPNALVKGRNEPFNVRQIYSIVSSLKKIPEETLLSKIYENMNKLFFPDRHI